MAIKIIPEDDVNVSESELRHYRDEWKRSFTNYVGTPPSLEEFIRQKQNQEVRQATESYLRIRGG